MIIDVSEQFRKKFLQFQKQSNSQGQESGQQSREYLQQKRDKDQGFKQNIAIEYQLSLKYAKSVYLSLCKIDQILKDKKENYFSNAAYSLSSFTNQQRNQFDQQTKAALKMCSDQIDQLKVSSQRQIQGKISSKKKNKVNQQTYAEHLRQVVLCLHQYFKKLHSQFAQFLTYNQLKKKKILSTLSIEPQKTQSAQTKYFHQRKPQDELEQTDKSNVNSQLQRQAHLFYLQKIQDQKKALETKQTIQTITSMLQQMGKKVLDQELLTSSFQEIGSVGLSFIDQGNRNLLEANTLAKSAGKYWVLLFLGLAFSLLFVDFLKS